MTELTSPPIAVVGISAIMPNAPTGPQFWSDIRDGRYGITDVPPERWDPDRLCVTVDVAIIADSGDPSPGLAEYLRQRSAPGVPVTVHAPAAWCIAWALRTRKSETVSIIAAVALNRCS